ncbi:rhomboid family intramembrane serine protease (plasmid) [Pedobacter sp. BS3]|uniref:rhomboid family intramembrane serine protease n=1 Tax=Pedobacter sp. BS3 TaxID=2567937 RepID=UPI0011EDC02D|nr:rhomboid family intramembrane serine protease [Pedobacter sp. BS3]TZF85948.1 rhomboid family intramembrane serine protease [Pedobacter sp. BS3]
MNSFKTSPFANIPTVVKNLIIINIIFFIATLVFNNQPLIQWFGVFYPDSPFFRIWQIVTYMFMHGSIGHIFLNMFALFMFGSSLEYVMGPKRFLNFYLLTGFGALALQFLVQAIEVYGIVGSVHVGGQISGSITQAQFEKLQEIYRSPMVGASGAIFGILIAFGMLFPETELFLIFFPVPIKAKYFIPLYILLELYLGIKQYAGDSVAHFAHLGGALFGFILIKAWGYKRHDRFL